MDNKIDDLMYEAGLTAQGCWDELDAYAKKSILKFAELIVKECINTMEEHINNTSMLLCNPPKSSAIWDARNAIEKKFGVKQ